MSHETPFDVDMSRIEVAQLHDLGRARSSKQACAAACQFIAQHGQFDNLQIVWDIHQPQLLAAYGSDLSVALPDSIALTALHQAEFAPSARQPACVFVPLLARGELAGWMYLSGELVERTGMLQLVASQLGSVLALHAAAAQHEERVQHLQTLTEIGQQLSGVLDLDSLVQSIYTAASRVVDISDFYLALYDIPAHEFSIAFVVENYVPQPASYRWAAGESLNGALLRQRTPIYTNDYANECQRRGLQPQWLGDLPKYTAWLGIPLFANDVPIGIMNISTRLHGCQYSQEQIELLAAIGTQAAIALANAQLYQRSERQAQQLAVLNQIGRTVTSSLDPEQVPSLIMEQVCKLLNVAEGSLLLVDETSGDLVFAYTNGPIGDQLLGTHIPRGRGIAGHVVQTGESLIVNDVRGDTRFYDETDKSTGFTTRSLLAVALRGVGGVEGVIEVMNRRDESDFTAEDRRLLEAIASQAVIALANAQRFAQVDRALTRRAQELAATNAMLQHNLQSLTALNALSMALSSSLRDTQDIYTMTAHGAIAASGAAGATIVLTEGARLQAVVTVGARLARPQLEAVCQAVVESGRPQLEHTGHQAVFAVPLRVPQRLLGALCICYDDDTPDASDQEAVVLFATQAAAAVVNNELFTQLRGAHDHMASILASTREGIALITHDGTVAHANDALHRLTGLDSHEAHGISVALCLAYWQQRAAYGAEEWQILRDKLDVLVGGQAPFASGYLSATTAAMPSLEWVALPVRGSSIVDRGVLLVLRDITAAREAERMRQDLTNMIVHDLRSPLSSVMAAIDMLVKGISGDMNPAQQRVLGIAYNSSVQMLDMISTLLDISRLEDGRMPLAPVAAPIAPVIEQATDRLRTLAQERSITILQDVSPDLPPALIDRELVVRVAQNLLANAIKFSHRGSTVLVRAAAEQTNGEPVLCVSVCDRGIGIAPQHQERVFAKFGQVGESRGGSGLGLTFCKLAVEAHNGTIWLESQPGLGSTFFFTVPLAREA